MEQVAEVRELDPVPSLKAEVVTREDLPGLLDTLITDEDRELAAKITTLYRLLGHFSEDQDYLGLYQSFGASSILGLYSPIQDTLWVVSEGGIEELTDLEEQTLAHELVHALQDYHFDLDGTYDRVAQDPDRNMTWTSVVEGDASWHHEEYTEEYLWYPRAGKVFALGVLPQNGDIPITFIRELIFPYTEGADWAGEVLDEGGLELLNGYLMEPPAGTVCILHLELCLDGFEPESVQLPDLTTALGDGWEEEWSGTLGEFHLANFLNIERRLGESREAAAGWIGDSFATYVRDEEALAVLHVEFTSNDEAAEFRMALRAFIEDAGGQAGGGTLVTEMDDGRQFAVSEAGNTGLLIAISNRAGPAEEAMELLGAS